MQSELLWHSDVSTTLNVYTQAVSEQKSRCTRGKQTGSCVGRKNKKAVTPSQGKVTISKNPTSEMATHT